MTKKIICILLLGVLNVGCFPKSIKDDYRYNDRRYSDQENEANRTNNYYYYYQNGKENKEDRKVDKLEYSRTVPDIKRECYVEDIEFKEVPSLPTKEIMMTKESDKRSMLFTNHIYQLRKYIGDMKKQTKEHIEFIRKKCQD